MKLTIYRNNEVIRTTHYPNVERLYSDVHKDLELVEKSNVYIDSPLDHIKRYNSLKELEFKVKHYGMCHLASIKTLKDHIQFFVTK